MNKVFEWGDVFIRPLEDVFSQVLSFLPQLISALIVLIIGGIAVRIVVSLLAKLLAVLKVDNLMEKTGVSGELSHLGVKTKLSDVLTKVVKLFLHLIVLMAVVEILGIEQLSDFLDTIIDYLPNIFVAVIILAIGVMVSGVVQSLVEGTMGSIKVSKSTADTAGKIAKVAILAFTVMATLVQLGVVEELIQTLFSAIVYGVALAVGLSFGLGGKDAAAKCIENWKK